MADRYYSAEPIEGSSATLSGNEAHHLLHVMRARPGDEVIVFDGHGGEFAAEISNCGRSEVELTVGPRLDVERELPYRVTLAVALPKGDRQRWLVEKAVELGVSTLIPLQCDHSQRNQSEPTAKLLRYVIEASKQCGRNRLMDVAAPSVFSELLKTHADVRLLAHPDGDPLGDTQLNDQCSLLIAIGPEGGFSAEEVSNATDAAWQIVGLGKRILRVETAALALLARLVT